MHACPLSADNKQAKTNRQAAGNKEAAGNRRIECQNTRVEHHRPIIALSPLAISVTACTHMPQCHNAGLPKR